MKHGRENSNWKSFSGRIIVVSPYNPAYLSKIKSISKYSWHIEAKYCCLTNTDENVENIVAFFRKERRELDPRSWRDKKYFLERE